jgi:hypothetical protein
MLQKVTVTSTGISKSDVWIEMIANGAQSITNFAGARIEVSGPTPLGTMVASIAQSVQTFACGSYDRILDYAGSSGMAVQGVISPQQSVQRVYLPGESGFSAFIASGTAPEVMPIAMEATGQSGYIATGGVDRWVETAAWGLVTVVYEYLEEYVEPSANSGLGYLVWWDYNANGVADAGEPGIAGATLVLKDGTGAPVIGLDGLPMVRVTSSDGEYGFGELQAGVYSVEVTLPSDVPPGTVQTYDLDGLDTPNAILNINLPADTILDTVNFGYTIPVACSVTADATQICDGSAAQFAAEVSGGLPPFEYLWTGPQGFSSTDATIAVGVAGTYALTVTDSVGLTSDCEIDLGVLPTPDISLMIPYPLPVGSSKGNILSAPAGAASYSWTLVSGAQDGWAITGGQGSSTITYTAGKAGTSATFRVTARNANGCASSGSISFLSMSGAQGCTPGFWGNKNGLALESDASFALLTDLCLRNEDGSDRDFLGTLDVNRTAISSWLGGNARNMAYKLSQHLAAFRLNVLMGWYSGSQSTFQNPLGAGTVTADQLIVLANAELCAHPVASTATADDRARMEAIKNVLDKANNDCRR